jgi:hypothetical protein
MLNGSKHKKEKSWRDGVLSDPVRRIIIADPENQRGSRQPPYYGLGGNLERLRIDLASVPRLGFAFQNFLHISI